MVEIPAAIRKISNWKGAFVLGREWALMIFYFWLVIRVPHPAVWIACYILLARQSYGLFVLYHEAAHGLLFSSKKLNNLAGEWLCGAPITFILENFKSHFQHHKEPMAATDPDLKMIGGYPIPRASLFRKLLRDACGITNFRGHLYPDYVKGRATSFRPFIPMTVVSGLMWLGFWLAGHPWLFFIFWMLPGATVAVVFVRLGVLSQHAALKASRDQRQTARTVLSPWSYFLAPLNLNYHQEHHLYPQIPGYNLPRLHRHLRAQGVVGGENVYSSYLRVFREITY